MIDVRPARPDEADIIHALTSAAYEEYRATPAPSSALAETAREVRDGLGRGTFRAAIAERDGAAVGSVRYRFDSSGLYFFRLAVHPEYRRQGVARALVAWLEKEAADHRAGRLWCQVRLIVPRNVEVYRSAGFDIVEQHIVMRNGLEVPVATMAKRTSPPNPLSEAERGSRDRGRGTMAGRARQVVVGQRVSEYKIEKAKSLRREMTPEEGLLWQRLRDHRLDSLKFRRQQIVAGYIADFYCHEASLAIELDGGFHEEEYDARRDTAFSQQGIRVLRIPNEDVRRNIDAVLTRIQQAASEEDTE